VGSCCLYDHLEEYLPVEANKYVLQSTDRKHKKLHEEETGRASRN